MRFEVGERVICDGDRGTIRDAVRQKNTSDLFRIDWDNDPKDDDLYPDLILTSLDHADVVSPWDEARAPCLTWRAA